MANLLGASTITKDHRIVLPKKVRAKLDLGPDDLVAFEVLSNGELVFYKITARKEQGSPPQKNK